MHVTSFALGPMLAAVLSACSFTLEHSYTAKATPEDLGYGQCRKQAAAAGSEAVPPAPADAQMTVVAYQAYVDCVLKVDAERRTAKQSPLHNVQ